MLKINHKGHELTIICGLETWRIDAIDSAGFTWALLGDTAFRWAK